MTGSLIYFGCALLAVLAMQWPPLWIVLAVVVSALLVKVEKNKRERAKAKKLPEAAMREPVVIVDDVYIREIPAPEHREPEPPSKATQELFDPMCELHPVFRTSIDWRQFDIPTFQRRNLRILDPIKAPEALAIAAPQQAASAEVAKKPGNEPEVDQLEEFTFIYS